MTDKATKERPILFSGEMVSAVLAGKKTVTRRVMKQQPPPMWRCPYGVVGDQLWVRETWGCAPCYDKFKPSGLPLSCARHIDYRADKRKHRRVHVDRWRRSIHMPRWASRIQLEITDIRVERVQEISEEGAIAEGVRFGGTYWLGGIHATMGSLKCWEKARDAFCSAWDSINAKRENSWASNPWVWVVEFKMEEGGTDG